jgi:hypothetical protein
LMPDDAGYLASTSCGTSGRASRLRGSRA